MNDGADESEDDAEIQNGRRVPIGQSSQGNEPMKIEITEKANTMLEIVDACHMRKEERRIKTWKDWLKDPSLYRVQTQLLC